MIQVTRRKMMWLFTILLVVAAGYFFMDRRDEFRNDALRAEETAVSEEAAESSMSQGDSVKDAVTEERIAVHVSGAVSGRDQLYYLPAGARVADAIQAAGPVLKQGDLSRLNLAKLLEDGEKVYVPRYGEVYEESEASDTGESSGKININKASVEELMHLSGIGQTYAERIVEYRETEGSFQKPEDLMNVKGIGEATFQKVKDQITV